MATLDSTPSYLLSHQKEFDFIGCNCVLRCITLYFIYCYCVLLFNYQNALHFSSRVSYEENSQSTRKCKIIDDRQSFTPFTLTINYVYTE